MLKKLGSLIFKPFQFIWGLFLSGLITLLPIALTFVIFTLAYQLLEGWLEPIRKFRPTLFETIPYSELLLILAIVLFFGILLRVLFLRSIVHSVERMIAKIPLVRPVYTGIKQLVHAFSAQDKLSFKKVVLIEFPRPGMYSIGFLTSEVARQLPPSKDEKFFSIFVPSTPTPITGYLVMLPEKDIRVLDLSHQEAMALIISGGIIQPDRFKDPI